ncbi:hypothetical protein LV75_002532 [Actinokineospora diospyrosa]|uniref:Uncharacterized protein n=1 Tax=Actinokineospora diospyrosa TaxID=103728 RepID=A0ABT1ICE5_9PSEU|nr:hypothetical protein [Actinokineospora diospyrosa]
MCLSPVPGIVAALARDLADPPTNRDTTPVDATPPVGGELPEDGPAASIRRDPDLSSLLAVDSPPAR